MPENTSPRNGVASEAFPERRPRVATLNATIGTTRVAA